MSGLRHASNAQEKPAGMKAKQHMRAAFIMNASTLVYVAAIR
jgi:hypothetical protein